MPARHYVAFYRLAMEVCLRLEDGDELNRFADALETHCLQEPLPRTDFYIARALHAVDALEADHRRPRRVRGR